jgi:A/G-specific adenine glycosylase
MNPETLAALTTWGSRNFRTFPWRGPVSAYQAVISEMMLIRTRADQAVDVWSTFIHKYPDEWTLSEATEADLARTLGSLGLEWRSRMIGAFGKAAVKDNKWSRAILDMPGCGPYVTAAAMIATKGRGVLPIDVTIARVLTRFWGLILKGEPRRDAQLHARVRALGDVDRRFFYAVLDLAALVCTPKTPRCSACPLVTECAWAGAHLRGSSR